MPAWEPLSGRIIEGGALSREEALGVLRAPDALVLEILADAWRVRQHHRGALVKVHILENARSGGCPEDCAFCAQSAHAESLTERYPLRSAEELLESAREARARGAWKFCIVTATRSPPDRDLDILCEAVRRIKREIPIRVCTSLGLLDPERAGRLAASGVDRFNHNLETSERFFPRICTTHTWADRVATLRCARSAGMELCSGGIVGMGETDEDVVDLGLAVRALDVHSIPVNFLDPRPGTALAARPRLSPAYALKVLCLFRFLNPDKDIRAAGGREVVLRDLQPLALYPANSIFTQGYLTTPGRGAEEDLRMIRDLGMETCVEPEASACLQEVR